MRFFSGTLSSCLLLSATAGVLACVPPCLAISDSDRKEDLPVPVTPKPKPVSVYGDKHLKAIEAQIVALAKQNNSDWSEKKEDQRTQELKRLFEKETEPHALATLSIWAWMNREDDPLVRKVYHYDKIIESAFYQSMFRISDIGGDDAAPALHRIMHQVNMNKDAMDKLRDCLNAVTPDGFTSESRVIVHFSDDLLSGRPAPEEVAQFVVPLREALWRLWKSPTLIASEIHAKAQFTVDETLTISNLTVDIVTGSSPKSVWTMKSEYKKNALKGLKRLKITQPLPLIVSKTNVVVEFYGP
ncbi:MAG: hypothetical protein C0469_05665 [Cyanobacteria bacterium DS2.3.42]|nr:hypothetical protein [Cyanobacteria bacterium DS2.3.42]